MFGDVFPPGGNVPGTINDYPVVVSATAPTSPTKGMAWLDTATNQISVYNGATWIQVAGGGGGGGNVPTPTKQDQLLRATKALQWGLTNALDGGRF